MIFVMAKKILFIEDDFLLGKMYKTALENNGYEVDLQPDGEAAQKRLEEQIKYDLILLDLLLPGISGIDFLRSIKNENSSFKNIPIYILTNVEGTNSIAEGVALGAEGYFLKVSTTPKKLVETINQFFAP